MPMMMMIMMMKVRPGRAIDYSPPSSAAVMEE